MLKRLTEYGIALGAAVFLTCGFAPALASFAARSKTDTQFTFPTDRPITILVFRPDVQVGSMSMGGVEEANAEWTATARTNLANALRNNQSDHAHKLVFLDDQNGSSGKLIADYQALFRAVSQAIVTHKFAGSRLPTKKDKFDWTLGPGAAELGKIDNANYALLLYSHDAYGTTGRKIMQILLAGGGIGIAAGMHVGYSALVDLNNGNIVWFGLDPMSGGDPRNVDGATKRIRTLLKSMPGQAQAAAVPAVATGSGVVSSTPATH